MTAFVGADTTEAIVCLEFRNGLDVVLRDLPSFKAMASIEMAGSAAISCKIRAGVFIPVFIPVFSPTRLAFSVRSIIRSMKATNPLASPDICETCKAR